MRRSIFLAVVFSLIAGRAFATQTCSSSSLPLQKGWVAFDILGGRLTAVNAFQCKSQEALHHNPLTGVSESFAIVARDGQTRIRYELINPQMRLVVDVREGSQVEIVRHPTAERAPPALRYMQPAQGEVTLTVGNAGAERVVRAGCLWRLMLADPELCGEHLLPVFALLRPYWRIAEDAEELEQTLLDRAAAEEPTQRPHWEELVAQLDDKAYQKRSAAHRQLLEAGPQALPFLQEVSTRRLAPEPRRRIAEIIARLSLPQTDTPVRVAARLMEDKAVWLALMARADYDTRQLAAARLAMLWQRPIEFDPNADDTVRSDQLARLRSRVARN
jgi:hypothetical protein